MATETDTDEREETRDREPEKRDEKPGGKPGEKPGDKKKDSKKQTIIAAAAVLGLIIAWLSFRKGGSSSSSSSLPAGGSIGAYTPSGTVAGSSGDSSAYEGLQSLLSNQSQQLQQLESALVGLTPTASTSGTDTSTTPQPFALYDWSAPVVTGNIHQDTDISQSSYVAGLYAKYKASPSKATQVAYENAVNQFDAAKKAGLVNQGSLQQAPPAASGQNVTP